MYKQLLLVAMAFAEMAALGDGPSPWGCAYYTDGSVESLTKTNALGDAVLTDADLASGKTISNIVFLVDATVGQIKLSGDTVLFSGNPPGVRNLKTRGLESMFDLSGTAGEWTFRGLSFEGLKQTNGDFAPYDGGAILIDGGSFTLDGCTFAKFVTRFTGGAVSAMRLTGDSAVTNCTFNGNVSKPINGYGGALYATKATGTDVCVAITGSSFTGNMAENGGAICTLTVAYDDEEPLDLNIGGSSVFSGNSAVYHGGALIAEGAIEVSGSNTLFSANRAGLSGGAVCLTGIEDESLPVTFKASEAKFFGNTAGTNTTWAAGGAVAVMLQGCKIDFSDHLVFSNNVADTGTGDEHAFGGAVYAASGVTNSFTRVAFLDNRAANASGMWCYGGAVSAEAGKTTVDTCVFDCGESAGAKCYGNAVDFNAGEVLLRNSTFRRGRLEAVSTYKTALAVTNCVVVGNGLDSAGDADLYLEETALSMAYTAYGSFLISDTAKYAGTNNLSGRVDSEVYDGDSLRLRPTGFNPVAGLGIAQSVTDFVGATYGSKDCGHSMGAYETPTEKFVIVLDGTRDYDGTTGSNECVWTWSAYTNRADVSTACGWSDLVSGAAASYYAAYDVASWTYADSIVGYYASTNGSGVSASVTPTNDRVEWLTTIVRFEYTGTINPAKTVKGWLIPTEFAWTGSEVKPGENAEAEIIVSNTVNDILVPSSEYRLDWAYNVSPTNFVDGVHGAQLHIICTNNYSGVVFTNYFAITAYLTEYTYRATDGTLLSSCVTTNGTLSGSNVVAVVDERTGYCLDYQNSTTNMQACVYGEGGTGNPAVTTLTMLYEQDTVGEGDEGGSDGVPDKYQKKVIFATVNGYWNGTGNGYDIVRWVTLTNGTYEGSEGMWSASGSHTLTSSEVPGVGEQPFERFARESESGGSWNTVPTGSTVSSTGFPIYFYSPAMTANGGRTDGGSVRPDLNMLLGAAMLGAAESGEDADVSGLKSTLAITDFAIGEDGEVAGAVEAQVVNTLDNSPLARMALENSKIEIWGAETLGGEWFKVYDATTDANGVWTLQRTRSASTVSATRTANGDRTASWDVSGAGRPKFFRVKLGE